MCAVTPLIIIHDMMHVVAPPLSDYQKQEGTNTLEMMYRYETYH